MNNQYIIEVFSGFPITYGYEIIKILKVEERVSEHNPSIKHKVYICLAEYRYGY